MILYKIDSQGRMRTWESRADGDLIIQKHGLIDGKKVISKKKAKPKNIGRSNETTAHEQALFEIESLYKQKQDKGYFTSIEEAKSEKKILPMLAKSFNSAKNKIKWGAGVFAQRKFDGQRGLVFIEDGKASIYSRKGIKIETLSHITDEFERLGYLDGIYDGEIFVENETFQYIMSAIKKEQESTYRLKFYLYDIVSSEGYNMRKDVMDKLEETDIIHICDSYWIESEEQLKDLHQIFIAEGFEGTMIRLDDYPYEIDKRSFSLIKYKDFKDEVFEIIDIEPSDARPEQGVVILKTSEGTTFSASPKMSHTEREELLTHKDEYIGKMGEIRFFEWTTSESPVPRFPVFLGVRNDK